MGLIRGMGPIKGTTLTEPLVAGYDAALFDLDGVVYLGPDPVPGAVLGLAGLRRAGVRLGYVTNNAARSPQVVVEHLRELGIELADSDVITSAQAGAQLLLDRFGAGAKVLAVGGAGVLEALTAVGLVPVRRVQDHPVAVMQGYDPDLAWGMITEAAIAIQQGAYWLATNTDSTRPTDRGLVPGNGAAVAAVRTAVEVDPEVAGKPFRPLIDEGLRRLGGGRAIFVGDRLDTDIAGAVRTELDSLLVFSGAHRPADLFAADPDSRPTHIGLNLGALLEPARIADIGDESARCGTMTVKVVDRRCELTAGPGSVADALDAAWATAQICWRARDRGEELDASAVLAALSALA